MWGDPWGEAKLTRSERASGPATEARRVSPSVFDAPRAEACYLPVMPVTSSARRRVPPAARVRLLRHPEPVGRRERAAARAARLLRRWRRRAPASRGRSAGRDNGVTLDEVLAHLARSPPRATCRCNADFEGGFAVEPDEVARERRGARRRRIAGLSIEDSTGDAAIRCSTSRSRSSACARRARAIDDSGTGVVLTGAIRRLHRRPSRPRARRSAA